MDKMIQTQDGEVIVTNDGATILRFGFWMPPGPSLACYRAPPLGWPSQLCFESTNGLGVASVRFRVSSFALRRAVRGGFGGPQPCLLRRLRALCAGCSLLPLQALRTM